MSELEPIESHDAEYWQAKMARRRALVREYALDEDGELYSLETFKERLKQEHGFSIEWPKGSPLFDASDAAPDTGLAGSAAGQAFMFVTEDIHPDDFFDPLDEAAESMAEFDRCVTPMFNDQLESDDPFPLHVSVGQSGDE